MVRNSQRNKGVSAGGEAFYCENRQSSVKTLFCLDSFVDVNALNIKDSQCFKCPQGQRIRNDFSTS